MVSAKKARQSAQNRQGGALGLFGTLGEPEVAGGPTAVHTGCQHSLSVAGAVCSFCGSVTPDAPGYGADRWRETRAPDRAIDRALGDPPSWLTGEGLAAWQRGVEHAAEMHRAAESS